MSDSEPISTPDAAAHCGFVQVSVRLRHAIAWLTVRPRRWFFWNCIAKGSFGTKWLPTRREEWDNFHFGKDRQRTEWEMIEWPNLHWVLSYRTVFAFFKWLYWDGWRPLCQWKGRNGCRSSFPWHARLVKAIGRTTAGVHLVGGECYHCASVDGNQVDLVDDETGKTFVLEETWSTATMDGTDHWFRGTTICPKCGHRQPYQDGSL